MSKADRKEAVVTRGKPHQAAAEGQTPAKRTLGFLYYYGHGVRQSSEEAARWYRKAADQEHSDAQLNLGALYSKGKGVRQNSEEAAR